MLMRHFPAEILIGNGGLFTSDWFIEFENAYASERVGNCNRCPHKGHPLGQVLPDISGQKVCPLHGLTWNADGTLARRGKEPSVPNIGVDLHKTERALKGEVLGL